MCCGAWSLPWPEVASAPLVGGNGSGKSTLLKSICGSVPSLPGDGKGGREKGGALPQGGTVSATAGPAAPEPEVSVRPQTVAEDLAELGGRRPGTGGGMHRNRELLNSHPYDLSGGELQKAALARCCCCWNPYSAAGRAHQGSGRLYKEQFARLLARFQGKGGTILMVSHDVEFCARFADEAAPVLRRRGDGHPARPALFRGQPVLHHGGGRMSRAVFPEAVTNEEVIALCNGKR